MPLPNLKIDTAKCVECNYLRTGEKQADYYCGESYCELTALGISEEKLNHLRQMCYILDSVRIPDVLI